MKKDSIMQNRNPIALKKKANNKKMKKHTISNKKRPSQLQHKNVIRKKIDVKNKNYRIVENWTEKLV